MPRISESQWLENFGFSRFPFDRPEAESEGLSDPATLNSSFVFPVNFDNILGNPDAVKTSLMFAARGTGKTTCRVMLDYYCRNGEVRRQPTSEDPRPYSYVLSIPHTHLYAVLHAAQGEAGPQAKPGAVTVDHHVVEILRRAMVALVDLFASVPEVLAGFRGLSTFAKQDLSWLILKYGVYLTREQIDYLDRSGFGEFLSDPPSAGSLAPAEKGSTAPAWGFNLMDQRGQLSPIEHLRSLVQLARQMQIPAVYILVDGVDEIDGTAEDPALAYRLIQPVLACLPLMDGIPHMALKFFLPTSLKPLVGQDKAVRFDRNFPIDTLSWSEADLIEILHKRLSALILKGDRTAAETDRVSMNFAILCDSPLRGSIEQRLAHAACGNPRSLFVLCGLMVSAHCNREPGDQQDPYLLTQEDYDRAWEQYQKYIQRIRDAGGAIQPPPILTTCTSAADQPAQVSAIGTLTISLANLIKQPEGETLEFKASMFTLTKEIELSGEREKRRKEIEEGERTKLREQIVKEIAGFLNQAGGILIIGVDDHGQVIGLQKDFDAIFQDEEQDQEKRLEPGQLLEKQKDIFLCRLTYLTNERLGALVQKHLQFNFAAIDGLWVCVIRVEKSPTPVFYGLGQDIYVRDKNQLTRLKPKDMGEFIKTYGGK